MSEPLDAVKRVYQPCDCYSNRCRVFFEQRAYALAVHDCATALGLNPNLTEAPQSRLGVPGSRRIRSSPVSISAAIANGP